MTLKATIIDGIIDIEGGYVNNPIDSGGKTNYGITEQVARDYGYMGDLRDMPRRTAFEIYAERYWYPVRAGDLAEISEALAFEVVDTGINAGIRRAGIFLQRSLNVLNNREKYYSDIMVDGLIGQATINAVTQYARQRDISVLVKMLNCLQGAFYVELAEKREKDEAFIYGWIKNRIEL